MASADFSLRGHQLPRPRRPFRRKARSPQVRHVAFSAQPPDLHRLSLGRQSFAALGPLALLGSASYPIPVRRLADSLAPSFSPPLTVGTLGFTWIVTTYSPEDSHLQVTCHAGHTEKRVARESPGPLSSRKQDRLSKSSLNLLRAGHLAGGAGNGRSETYGSRVSVVDRASVGGREGSVRSRCRPAIRPARNGRVDTRGAHEAQ